MEDNRTLEDMDEPCPLDICDGSGIVEDLDSYRVRKCPHVMDEDQYDPDRV